MIFFLYSELGLVPRSNNVKFQLNNPRISKSYVEDEVVGGIECILMSVLISTSVLLWYCTWGKESLRKQHGAWITNRPDWISKDFHFMHVSLLCLALVLTINGALTNSLKLIIGNFRPDFLARCMPKDVTTSKSDFYGLDICQQEDKGILYEGLKSTPSGHSSFITSGLGFIFIWQSKYVIGKYWRHIWCLILMAIVMISRITDHRHHWYDVLSGCSLGCSIIYCCWRWVFSTRPGATLPIPVSIPK